MSILCKFGFHSWDGCQCSKCAKTRDNAHDWSIDCEKCTKCGNYRDNAHDWSKNSEECNNCDEIRTNVNILPQDVVPDKRSSPNPDELFGKEESPAQKITGQRQREDVDLSQEPRPNSLMEATARGQTYASAHPCSCGGAWKMNTFDSPIPEGISGMVCNCSNCGAEKLFAFRFWKLEPTTSSSDLLSAASLSSNNASDMPKRRCINCGVMILYSTFVANKGFCAQCSKGPEIAEQRRQKKPLQESKNNIKQDNRNKTGAVRPLSGRMDDISSLNQIGTTVLVISKESVLNKDISNVEHFLDSVCLAQLKNGQEDYSVAVLSIDGYNDDTRGLWQITEVREWYKTLHLARPYALYFISPASIQIYVTCLEPFLPGLLPTEHAASNHHPVVKLVTYEMYQFIDLLRTVMLIFPDDLKDRVLSEANERVFSALSNLNEGKVEPI